MYKLIENRKIVYLSRYVCALSDSHPQSGLQPTQDVLGGTRDARAGAEDELHATIVQELVVGRGNHPPADDHDVVGALGPECIDQLRHERLVACS
jgi:hypothetical protein